MLFTDAKQTTSSGCSTQSTTQHCCPECTKVGNNVGAITLKSQLKKESFTKMQSSIDEFSFCINPKCDTVYYSHDSSETFTQAEIKSKVTIKNNDPKTPLCYCRKLLKENVIEMIKNKESNIPTKIKDILASGKSFCEKSNPRGNCCTEDIKNFLADYEINWGKSSCC
jgi:Zinc binding domain